MSSLTFKLDGAPGTIGMHAFVVAVTKWQEILKDLDIAISGVTGGSLRWVVTDLKEGSLLVGTESYSRLPDKNFSGEVVHALIGGMRILETEGTTPPYLSEQGIGFTKSMLKLIGDNGVSGIEILNHSDSVKLTAQASANVDLLLPVRYVSIGSVEGRLEQINVHTRTPRFTVYHHRTRKAVACAFPREMLDEIKGFLGEPVVVQGRIQHNAKHEPLRIELESIRPLRTRTELPALSLIRGIDPTFTGDMTSAEFLRSVNGE